MLDNDPTKGRRTLYFKGWKSDTVCLQRWFKATANNRRIRASNVFRVTTRNLSSVRVSALKSASFAADEARGLPPQRPTCVNKFQEARVSMV